MTRTHMLDTDTVSFALRGMGGVAERLLAHRPSQVCVSSISVAELRFGACVKKSRRLHRLIDTFLGSVDTVPFDAAAADRFGAVAASLRNRGASIGQMDALIAAHALAVGLTLVTHNASHFSRVAGLRTEDWL